MPAILVSTADAVLNALADHRFSQEFEPVRSYADWELPLEDQDQLHADVVPVGSPDMELETRGSVGYVPQVDIVIRKRLASDQQEADGTLILPDIDDLVFLVQEIAEYFMADRLSEFDEAAWERTQMLAAFKPSHLRQYRQFTGIVRLTFKAQTDLA
jgi:hypothetical protein